MTRETELQLSDIWSALVKVIGDKQSEFSVSQRVKLAESKDLVNDVLKFQAP